MSDSTTQTQVLYEVLAEETLRAAKEIADLRDSIPKLIEQGARDLTRMSDANLDRFRAASQELAEKASSFEQTALQVHQGLVATKISIEQYIKVASDRNLESGKAEMLRNSVAFAEAAAREALKGALVPVASEVVANALKATEELHAAAKQATDGLAQVGWRHSLRLAVIVAVSLLVISLGNRALDNAWPWKLTPDEQVFLSQGKVLSEIWPKLGKGTQIKINELIRSTSGK